MPINYTPPPVVATQAIADSFAEGIANARANYAVSGITGLLANYEFFYPFGLSLLLSGNNFSSANNIVSANAWTMGIKSGGGNMPFRSTNIYNANGRIVSNAIGLSGINGMQHNGVSFPTGSFSRAYLIEIVPDSQERYIGQAVAESSAPQRMGLAAGTSRLNIYYHNGTTNTNGAPNDYQLGKGHLALVIHTYDSTTNVNELWVNGEKSTLTAALPGPITDDFIGVQPNSFIRSTGINALAYRLYNKVLSDAEKLLLCNHYQTLLGYTYVLNEVCGSSIVQNDPTSSSSGANGTTDTGNRNWFAQFLREVFSANPAAASRLHFMNHGRSSQGIQHHLANQSTIYGNWTKPVGCSKVNLIIGNMMTNDLVAGRTPAQCRDDHRSFVDQRMATNRYNNGKFVYCTDIARNTTGTLNGAGGLLKQTNDLIAADMAPGGYIDAAVRAKGMTPYFIDFGGNPYFDVVNGNSVVTQSYSNVVINGVTYGSVTPVVPYFDNGTTDRWTHPTYFGTALLGNIFFQGVGATGLL